MELRLINHDPYTEARWMHKQMKVWGYLSKKGVEQLLGGLLIVPACLNQGFVSACHWGTGSETPDIPGVLVITSVGDQSLLCQK